MFHLEYTLMYVVLFSIHSFRVFCILFGLSLFFKSPIHKFTDNLGGILNLIKKRMILGGATSRGDRTHLGQSQFFPHISQPPYAKVFIFTQVILYPCPHPMLQHQVRLDY